MQSHSSYQTLQSGINALIARQQQQIEMYSLCVELADEQATKWKRQLAQVQTGHAGQTRRLQGWDMEAFRLYTKGK